MTARKSVLALVLALVVSSRASARSASCRDLKFPMTEVVTQYENQTGTNERK